MSNFMTWFLDTRVLTYLTNGVLPETLFLDTLQQKECRSMDKFYRKSHKHMKLEDSKEALRKAKWVEANKKNDQGTVPDNNKG